MFWPGALGAIDSATLMSRDSAKTISELAAYADKIACVQGMDFRYSNNHDGGPIAKVANRVTDQLPGAVVGDVASPIYPVDLGTHRRGSFG